MLTSSAPRDSEGIETAAERDEVAEAGCDTHEGYGLLGPATRFRYRGSKTIDALSVERSSCECARPGHPAR